MAQFILAGEWDGNFCVVKDLITRVTCVRRTASELQPGLSDVHIYMLSPDCREAYLFAKSKEASCQAPQTARISPIQRRDILAALQSMSP